MDQINIWKYFKHLKHYTNLYGNLMLIFTKSWDDNVSESEKYRIFNDVFDPLCKISEKKVFLYGNDSNPEMVVGEQLKYSKQIQKGGKLQWL